ncbi:hypothetical protein KKG41_01030 [Patescibacteria group bacterium]|nr:hypothetical protein [Patescibacteria group bacterium]MBU1890287.1 hypothetical protein [Patescibacteria group bacterium]
MSMRVNGKLVSGDSKGVIYLNHLDNKEADVLFKHAHLYGEANFEHNYIDYTLKKEKDGTYTVEKR